MNNSSTAFINIVKLNLVMFMLCEQTNSIKFYFYELTNVNKHIAHC